jgi:PLP dependent protein
LEATPADALRVIRTRIAAAELAAGRPAGSVTLVAVSKGCPVSSIRALAQAGQRCFGESYLSEAIPKLDALAGLGLEWHFIGPIQSNKTRGIATGFDWAHGVDRTRIAQRLSDQRPPGLAPLNLCIQVNISAEAGKSGTEPDQTRELVRFASRLPRLRVRGLMAIPALDPDPAARRAAFSRLRNMQSGLVAEGYALDTLSIGMSDDFEDAIAEGATLVRIGTALFGPRT